MKTKNNIHNDNNDTYTHCNIHVQSRLTFIKNSRPELIFLVSFKAKKKIHMCSIFYIKSIKTKKILFKNQLTESICMQTLLV